jgi:hypothetical protein
MTPVLIGAAIILALVIGVIDHRDRVIPGWATTLLAVLGCLIDGMTPERQLTLITVSLIVAAFIAGMSLRGGAARSPIGYGDLALITALSAWVPLFGLALCLLLAVLLAWPYRRFARISTKSTPLAPPLLAATLAFNLIGYGLT